MTPDERFGRSRRLARFALAKGWAWVDSGRSAPLAFANALRVGFFRAVLNGTQLLAHIEDWARRAGPAVFRVLLVVFIGLAALAISLWWVARTYKGQLIWPLLVVGLITTSVGVYLAIYVERELTSTRELNRRRAIARSALSVVAAELDRINDGVRDVRAEYKRDLYVIGEFPMGSWHSVRPALTASVDSPAFLAELSTCYSRVEKLVRLLDKRMALDSSHTEAINALSTKISETLDDVEDSINDLRVDIDALIREPHVRGTSGRSVLSA